MISGVLKKASVFLQKGARVVIPAAGRSTDHEDKEFLKRFPEEYAKERKKALGASSASFGVWGY